MYGIKSNQERAERAQNSLMTYLEGEDRRAGEILAGNDDMAREAIQDQINDLLHLLNRKNLISETPSDVLYSAYRSYEEELAEELELTNA